MLRCSLCPGSSTCVPGCGPLDISGYYLLGEAPGLNEDKAGKPFVGRTGQELDGHYLPLTGLKRPNVRINNAISCMPTSTKGKLDITRRKDLDLLRACAEHHLYPELERMQPKLIIPMGTFACRAIDPGIELDMQHGIPVETEWGMTFPMYHPALGLHSPKSMLFIRTDWTRLRRYLIGKLHIPVDAYAGQEQYEEVTGTSHLTAILHDCNDYTMALDTEVMRGGQPFCLTFSTQPGTGYLIRAEQVSLLQLFQSYISQWRGWLLLHNAMFDQPVLGKMGIHLPIRLVRDTMVMIYHLGNLPQALKTVSYRELGMSMKSFEDTVRPHSTKLCLDYLRGANLEEFTKPEAQMERNGDGRWKVYQPQGFSTKLKRFWTDYGEDNGVDVLSRWDNWEDNHAEVESLCGKWPGMCISHVPFSEVLAYSCRDSDATLRLWPLLKYMEHRVRKHPQERWTEGWEDHAELAKASAAYTLA